MSITEDRRYHSQIEILDQDRLKNLNIVLSGTGPIAHYIITSFCGLGVGNIYLLEEEDVGINKNSFLLAGKNQGKKLDALEEVINCNNQGINIEKRASPRLGGLKGLKKADIIIDASNNVQSKLSCLELARDSKIPFISTSSGKYSGKLCYFWPSQKIRKQREVNAFKLEEYRGLEQGSITSGVMGGLVTDLLLKFCMPTKKDKEDFYPCLPTSSQQVREDASILNPIYFNLKSDIWTGLEDNIICNFEEYSNKKILMVGAGSLGTFAGLGLALTAGDRGNTLDILDCKKVSPHNHNRQTLSVRYEGLPKVEALKKALESINPGLKVNPIYAKLEFSLTQDQVKKGIRNVSVNELNESNYDIIISCLDNMATRKHLIDYAVQNGLPMVTGGSGMMSTKEDMMQRVSLGYNGDAHIFIPQTLPCYECGYDTKIEIKEEPEIDDPIPGCEAREQTLVIPNLIAGTFQAGAAAMILSGFKDFAFNTAAYSNAVDRRLTRAGIEYTEGCECNKNE